MAMGKKRASDLFGGLTSKGNQKKTEQVEKGRNPLVATEMSDPSGGKYHMFATKGLSSHLSGPKKPTNF